LIGRGTFFTGERPKAAPETGSTEQRIAESRSVLILRRSVSIWRRRKVVEELQSRLRSQGHRVVEVSYTDSQDANRIIRGLPHFDACAVQTSFETISIETLANVGREADAIVIDGAVLAGTEVDTVGLEWGGAVASAVQLLNGQGHTEIGLVMAASFLLAAELGKMRFREIMRQSGSPPPRAPIVIEVPAWPHEDYEQVAVKSILAARGAQGPLLFSALIVLVSRTGKSSAIC